MDREHKSFFLSDNSEEIRKEKEKQSAIHSFLPLTSGGNKDETEYVFIDKDKAESVPGWIARLNKLAEYSKAKIRFQETDLKVK